MKIGGVDDKSNEPLGTLPQALRAEEAVKILTCRAVLYGQNCLRVACKCTVSMIPNFNVK